MLNNKESLDQIIVATPGLSSDAMALGRLPLHFTVNNYSVDMLAVAPGFI